MLFGVEHYYAMNGQPGVLVRVQYPLMPLGVELHGYNQWPSGTIWISSPLKPTALSNG
jgi:hypothetical protein